MSMDTDWGHAVEALRRGRREVPQHGVLVDAVRYRQEAERCALLAAQSSDPGIRAQLQTIVDTYRRLARQLEALVHLS